MFQPKHILLVSAMVSLKNLIFFFVLGHKIFFLHFIRRLFTSFNIISTKLIEGSIGIIHNINTSLLSKTLMTFEAEAQIVVDTEDNNFSLKKHSTKKIFKNSFVDFLLPLRTSFFSKKSLLELFCNNSRVKDLQALPASTRLCCVFLCCVKLTV